MKRKKKLAKRRINFWTGEIWWKELNDDDIPWLLVWRGGGIYMQIFLFIRKMVRHGIMDHSVEIDNNATKIRRA